MEAFWARRLPGFTVLHGRGLSLNRQAANPNCVVDGLRQAQILDNTADGTPALEEVQLYQNSTGSNLELTREDGQKVGCIIQAPEYLPETITMPAKGTQSAYIIRSGTYKNLTIEIPHSFTKQPQFVGLEIDQNGPIRLENVTIINKCAEGIGLKLTKCFDGYFSNVKVVAEQPVYSEPNAKHGRNNFLWCDFAGTHMQYGQINRGLLGEENFIAFSKWGSIDRGPIGQQSGPPMYRSLLYRCEQSYTGTTIGGSEGILWEAPNGWPVQGKCFQSTLTFTGKADVRVGVFVCDIVNKKWARIRSFLKQGDTYTIEMDRPLADGDREFFVGNCIVENTVVNSTFLSGKLGLHLFGRSIGNVCKLWDCRNVHDVVVEEVMTNEQALGVYGFAWNNVYDRLRTTGETRGIVRCTKYYDGFKPASQLPWHRYAT